MTDYSPLINQWYQSVQFRNAPFLEAQDFNTKLNSALLTEAQVQQTIIGYSYTTSYVNPIIREYQIAFNRVPDQGGESYWTGVYSSGALNISQISYAFASSPEFYANYGVTADSKITAPTLIKFYENMFCRAPDAAGLQFWLNQGLSTAATLTAFVTSPEAKTITASSIPAYQQSEILGTEATTGSLFQYGGCTDAPITIQMQTTAQTIDVKEPSDKVNVETVQQPVGSTWVTGSVVNGGGNTDINLRMNGNPGGGSTGSTVTANKILNLNVNLTDSGNLDASKFTNVSNVIINNGIENKVLTIDTAQLSSNYNISLTKAVTMKFASFANASGSSDTLILTGNNAGVSAASRATFDVIGDNKIETVDLNQTGNNYLNLNTGSAVNKIVLEGSGSSNINIAAGASGLVAGNLSSFDASRYNGDLVVKFDAGATSGLSSLPNIAGSTKSNTFIFERAFDNNADISISLLGSGTQRLGYSDGGILTKTYEIQGANGQFFISSDGTSTGSAFTNGMTTVLLGDGNNYVNLGAGADIVDVGNGNNTIYTGANGDIIYVGTGSNIVSGGDGADLFVTGGTHVTSLYTAKGQTGANTATGATVVSSNFDHYWGMQNNYKLQFDFISGGFSGGSLTSTTSVAGVNNAIVYVRGTEITANGIDTFTASANGTDTLVVYDTDTGVGTSFESIVFNGQYAASSTTTTTPTGGTTSTVGGTVIANAVTEAYTADAYKITSNYSPKGRIVIGGDGSITSTDATDTTAKVGTPSPSTIKSIDASGLLGVNGIEIVTNSANQNLSSIVGSRGKDLIRISDVGGPVNVVAGGGADVISFGVNRARNLVFTGEYTTTGQTGIQNTTGLNADATSLDLYTRLQSGDRLNFSFMKNGFSGGVINSSTSVAGNNNAITFVTGTYANGSFNLHNGPKDQNYSTLVVYDTDETAGTNYEAVVLLGQIYSGVVNGSIVTLSTLNPPSSYKITGVYSGTQYTISSSVPVTDTLSVSQNGSISTTDPNISSTDISQPIGYNQIGVTSIDASSLSGSAQVSLDVDLQISKSLNLIVGSNLRDKIVISQNIDPYNKNRISINTAAGDDQIIFTNPASPLRNVSLDGGQGINTLQFQNGVDFEFGYYTDIRNISSIQLGVGPSSYKDYLTLKAGQLHAPTTITKVIQVENFETGEHFWVESGAGKFSNVSYGQILSANQFSYVTTQGRLDVKFYDAVNNEEVKVQFVGLPNNFMPNFDVTNGIDITFASIPQNYKIVGNYTGTTLSVNSTSNINGVQTIQLDGKITSSTVDAADIYQPQGFNQAAVTAISAFTLQYPGQVIVNVDLSVSTSLKALVGSDADDTFKLSGSFRAFNIDGLNGNNQIIFEAVGQTIVDTQFASVKNIQKLYIGEQGAPDTANSVTLGTNAEAAGIMYVRGNIGNDTIDASQYTKPITIEGGGGKNILNGGSAGDSFAIIGVGAENTVHGNAGDDIFNIKYTAATIAHLNSLFGDAGNNTFIFDDPKSLVKINLDGGSALGRNEMKFINPGNIKYFVIDSSLLPVSIQNIQILTLSTQGKSAINAAQGTGLDTVNNFNLPGDLFTLPATTPNGVWTNVADANSVTAPDQYYLSKGPQNDVLTYYDVSYGQKSITFVGVAGNIADLTSGGSIILAHQ